MMIKDKVSIIVPVYNAEKYIKECLISIAEQSYHNIQLIIINDGSTDNSEVIIHNTMKKYPLLDYCYISQKNSGVSFARNKGMEYAQGKYLYFVDADDTIKNNCIDEMIDLIKKDKCELLIFNITQTKEFFEEGQQLLTQKEVVNSMLKNPKIGGYISNKLYKSEIIKQNNIKFKDNIKFMEDMLFAFEYCKYIKNAVYTNQNYYFYRKTNTGAVQSKKYNVYKSILEVIPCILKEYEEILEESVIHSLRSRYSSAGVYLNIYMFREGNFILQDIKYNLTCAKQYFSTMPLKHKIGYWGIKLFPKLFYIFLKKKNLENY